MLEVDLYIVASNDQVYVPELSSKKYVEGQGCYLLMLNGYKKGFFLPTNELTPNRVMLACLLDAVHTLTKPCKVNVYTRGLIGEKSFHKPKWRHYDLSSQYLNLVQEKQIECEFIVDNNHLLLLALKEELMKAKNLGLGVKQQII
ncbi:MAG: hypothetical protein ABS939_20055 [Psychrobacillus sp.]